MRLVVNGNRNIANAVPAPLITFVGSNLVPVAPTGQLSHSLTLPAHQAGDFAILYAHADNAGTLPVLSITVATGFTQLLQDSVISGRDSVEAIWYKRLISSGETNPSLTTTVDTSRSMSCHLYRGVNAVTPFDVPYTSSNGENNANPANPPITPVTDRGALLLFLGLTHNDVTTPGIPSTPTGFVAGQTHTGVSMRGQQTAYKLDYGVAGLITPGVWNNTTIVTVNAEFRCYTLALRPA